jgi:hypothetical protein
MRNKIADNLLLFALFGIALWFFGNLYEGIVIAPNMLNDSIHKAHDWQDFFVITNPIIFYVPVAPAATFIIIFLYFKTRTDNVILKRHLKRATIFGALAFALGILIITQINLKLFFGDIEKYSEEDIYKMSLRWNYLNVIRVGLLIPTLIHIFKAYVLTHNNTAINKSAQWTN